MHRGTQGGITSTRRHIPPIPAAKLCTLYVPVPPRALIPSESSKKLEILFRHQLPEQGAPSAKHLLRERCVANGNLTCKERWQRSNSI